MRIDPERPDLGFGQPTEDLVKLVRAYSQVAGEAERLQVAEQIFRRIEPDLHLFVFTHMSQNVAEDALQETLKAIATHLQEFRGHTTSQFWEWCYTICRNVIGRHYRDKATDRIQPLPPDELRSMIEASAEDVPLPAAIRHDLEYAMKLLTASKPECYDFLWKHFVFGLDYSEIAAEQSMSYDSVRMTIRRCLQIAKSLVS